jgi:HEAT repeat protein
LRINALTVAVGVGLLLPLLPQGVRADSNMLTLVDNLASDDAQARAHSMRLLKEFLYPEAVEPLVALLSHPNQMVRRDAASLLGQIGDPKAIPALSRASKDGDSAA